MTTNHEDVSHHYTAGDLGNQILAALSAMGKDVDALTIDDLAPVDHFHIRGQAATAEMMQWADIRPEQRLLDVGCGLGGTSRYLAVNAGCRVVGVDLTAEYCEVAEMLSARVGLADQTTYRQASALALPFADDEFDVVWTEHVQMNIADKAGFYAELARVLHPDGQLVFHDVFAGPTDELIFPVPWAVDPSISHLIGLNELDTLLRNAGFARVRWEDKTDASVNFFRTVLARQRTNGSAPLGLHLLMGDDAAPKFGNMLRNLEDDRLRVVQAVVKLEAGEIL